MFKDIAVSNADPEVRVAAIHSLAKTGDPSVVGFLEKLAPERQGLLGLFSAAVASLGKMNDKAARECLLRILKEAKDPELRRVSLYVVSDFAETNSALPSLREIIMGKNLELAKSALFQVSAIKSPGSLGSAQGCPGLGVEQRPPADRSAGHSRLWR